MPKRILLFAVFACLFHQAFGCGGSGGNDALNGNWAAETPSANGETVLLKFDSEQKTILVQAVRPLGDTVNVDEGAYDVAGENVNFNLPVLGGMSLVYEIQVENEQEKLILGGETYYRINPDGAPLSGQIQITQVTADELVEVSSYAPPHVAGQILVKEKGWSAIQLETPEIQALTVQSGGVAARLGVKREKDRLTRKMEREALDECRREGKSCTYNVLLKTQSLPNDPGYDEQWNMALINMGAVFEFENENPEPFDPDEEDLQKKFTYVAVIDTGIRKDHREFQNKFVWNQDAGVIWGADFVTHQLTDSGGTVVEANFSLDNDGDDLDPTDPCDGRDMGIPGSACSWHGTHLAGIVAAATNNSRGLAGMGGLSQKVKILPIRAMGKNGLGTLHDVAQGVAWACHLPNRYECPRATAGPNGDYVDPDNCGGPTDLRAVRPRADVINLSLGLAMTTDFALPLLEVIHECVREKKVVVIAAAGNGGTTDGFCEDEETGRYYANENCKFYPAADPSVIAVGAVTGSGAFAKSYSNYGERQFLVAPGGSGDQCVLSTVNPNVANGYWDLCGTSQAAAHVSGLAALLKAYDPELPLSNSSEGNGLVQILRDSAIYLGNDPAGWDPEYGFGLVNPWGALQKLLDHTPEGNPILSTSVNGLHFGKLGENATIILFNSGGGDLDLLSYSVETTDGGDWLSVAVKELNQPKTAPWALVATINREDLTEGNYTGKIQIHTNGGDKEIEVTMAFDPAAGEQTDEIDDLISRATSLLNGTGEFQNTEDIGEAYIYVWNIEKPEQQYRTKTTLGANYHFYLNLPSGKYNLVAVLGSQPTDCSTPEPVCLGFPDLNSLETIECKDGSCTPSSIVIHRQ
ncbi:MAG: S8 family serine peptidase [Deltaproteobacteria bacterium]|nr:S8 family serine peptidase [Deltaproteobacteria bacterium]